MEQITEHLTEHMKRRRHRSGNTRTDKFSYIAIFFLFLLPLIFFQISKVEIICSCVPTSKRTAFHVFHHVFHHLFLGVPTLFLRNI